MGMTAPASFWSVEDAYAWARRVAADVNRLEEALNAAAERHNLCSEYGEVLDDISSSLTTFKLQGPARRWRVRMEMDLFVSARGSDEATEVAGRIADHFASRDMDRRVQGVVTGANEAAYEAGSASLDDPEVNE